MRRGTFVLVGLLLAVVGASCSASESGPQVAADVQPQAPPESTDGAAEQDEPTPSSTTSTTVRRPAGGVVLAGDSIAGEVAPALAEALGDQPAPFLHVGQPNLAQYAALVPEWQARLAESDPWVVVVMLGTWERIVVSPDEPGWQDRYVDAVLAPFVQLLTDNGTHVAFVGYPPLADQPDLLGSGGLNDVWASLPERLGEVSGGSISFVDAGGVLRGPDGGFSRHLPIPGVGDVEVRQSDGRHLCPDGVMLVANEILLHLQQLQPELVPRDGWQRAGWRYEPSNFEHPELCPASF